jgi:hypothetical protein
MCEYCEMVEYLDKKLSTNGSRTSERLSEEAKSIIVETIISVTASPNFREEHAGMILMGAKYGYNQGLKEGFERAKESNWKNATIER